MGVIVGGKYDEAKRTFYRAGTKGEICQIGLFN